MLRIFLPIAFTLLFLLYILYHLIIKKDLKKQCVNVFAGISFLGLWVLIYYFLLRS